MRIAWFVHRYAPCLGGAERYSREMVRRFVARGDTADVFTSDAADPWYFTNPSSGRLDAPSRAVLDGASVHRLPVRHRPGQRYLRHALSLVPHWQTQCRWAPYMPDIPALSRVRGAYDAVFATPFPFTVFALAAMRTARAAGAPLIITPFLHLATPDDPIQRLYSAPHQIRLLQEADLNIVQTPGEAETVRSWGIHPDRILLLGMGFEPLEVTGGSRESLRRSQQIPPNAFVVGQLGANDPDKGTTDLLVALNRLNQGRRSQGLPLAHLLLAGVISPRFEADLALLRARGWPWLHLLGPIADSAKPDFFAALDVFAMPSRSDSFGIVFLEAWANALPVIGADAGGIPDVIRDGRDGLLVPFHDPDALAARLGMLLEDRDFATRLGRAGACKVANGYGWEDRFRTLADRSDALPRPRPANPSRFVSPVL